MNNKKKKKKERKKKRKEKKKKKKERKKERNMMVIYIAKLVFDQEFLGTSEFNRMFSIIFSILCWLMGPGIYIAVASGS